MEFYLEICPWPHVGIGETVLINADETGISEYRILGMREDEEDYERLVYELISLQSQEARSLSVHFEDKVYRVNFPVERNLSC